MSVMCVKRLQTNEKHSTEGSSIYSQMNTPGPEAEPGGFDQALTTRVRRKCSDFNAAIKKCDDSFRAAKSRGDAAAQELAQRRKACVRTSPLWSVVATAAVLGSIEELNAAYGAAKTAGWWLCMCIMRACTRACE